MQARLFKSLKLWSFYVDIEESIGTVETTKNVYDKILELRIANAQVCYYHADSLHKISYWPFKIIVNYAQFLEENKYFEESFKVESYSFRAVSFFSYFFVGLRARRGAFHVSGGIRTLEHLFIEVCKALCESDLFHVY